MADTYNDFIVNELINFYSDRLLTFINERLIFVPFVNKRSESEYIYIYKRTWVKQINKF
jgi:hypothetical protein